jgi:hypothetical protein
MAASPFEPAGGVAGRVRLAEGGGEQPLHFADGERDQCRPEAAADQASAFTYFPACSHVCVRAKHDLSAPIRAAFAR